MSQSITTEIAFELGGDADMTADGPVLLRALESAFVEAIELGGHAQQIRSFTVEMDDVLTVWSGPLKRPGRVILETRLT